MTRGLCKNGRKTSHSREIDVNSFHEEPGSSERTERPVIETSVIQARSSEDIKDFNVEQAHERTMRLISVTNTENESETFNVGDKTLRVTRRMRNSKKPLETPIGPAVPCKIMKKNCGSGASNKESQIKTCVYSGSK